MGRYELTKRGKTLTEKERTSDGALVLTNIKNPERKEPTVERDRREYAEYWKPSKERLLESGEKLIV